MKKRAFTMLLAAFITITSIPVPAFGETVSGNTVAIEEANEPEPEEETETEPESGYEPGGAWELDHGAEIPKRVYEDETDGELSAETATVGEDTRTFAASYDPRKLGKVTSIKNQGEWGLCGIYSACATMESTLIHQGLVDATIDLSELYYTYYSYYYENYTGSFTDYCDKGGIDGSKVFNIAHNRYCGPVLESQVPMTTITDSLTVSEELRFSNLYYLEKSYLFEYFNDTKAHRNTAKGLINDYGAIYACYYSYGSYYKDNPDGSGDTSYYDPYLRNTINHAIEIIGWDDNYAASNFSVKPEGNGAWLVKNSWGERGYRTAKGTGFYWISYYDKNLYHAYALKFSPEQKVVPLEASLKNSSLTIQKGQTAAAEVTFLPGNATETGCTYVSSDPKVATVDADGVITAKNYGSCTITVTSDFFKEMAMREANKPIPRMEMTVTVPGTYVSEIVTPQEEYCIYVDTENLTYDPIRIEASAYPEDATENSLEYSCSGRYFIVSPDGVVTLSDAGMDQLVNGQLAGIGNAIHIKTTDGSDIVKTVWVRVPKTYVSQITGLEDMYEIYEGKDLRLTPVVTPADATNKTLKYTCDTVYPSGICTVDSDGVVKVDKSVLNSLTADDGVPYCYVKIETTDGSNIKEIIYIKIHPYSQNDSEDKNTEQTTTPPTPAPTAPSPASAAGQNPKAQYNGARWTLKTTGATYKIKNGTAVLVKVDSKKTSFSVPGAVPYRGINFRVTEISANAFKNNKKLTKVVIGSNVVKIGKKAFYGCTNLKKVTIQSKRLASVGANAFNKISAKAVINIPKRCRSQYKKLLKGKTKASIKAM